MGSNKIISIVQISSNFEDFRQIFDIICISGIHTLILIPFDVNKRAHRKRCHQSYIIAKI